MPTSKKRKKPSGSRSRKRSTARRPTAQASGSQQKAAAKDAKAQSGSRSSRWSMARQRARAAGGGSKRERRGMGQFLKDVRMEMRKVTWPTRKDLVQSTLVVLVAVAIAGAYTGALDFIFSQVVDRLVDVLTP